MNFKKEKIIDSGMGGNVFLISDDNGNTYALKEEKILDDMNCDIENGLQYDQCREIDFCLNFGNTNPNQFVSLVEHKIKEDCDFEFSEKYKKHFPYLPKHIQEKFTLRDKGKRCIQKIFTLIDKNLNDGINDLSKKMIYSAITQITYAVYLMHLNGFTHNDLHGGNIGIVDVDDEYIDIVFRNDALNDIRKLKTHGKLFKIIDYGNILHKKYNLTDEELKIHNLNMENEIARFYQKFVKFEKDAPFKKLIKYDENDNDDDNLKNVYVTFLKSNEYEELSSITTNDSDKFCIYQIIFPETFQKLYLGDKFQKLYKPIVMCEILDYLVLWKFKDNLPKIIKYFITKTNEFE